MMRVSTMAGGFPLILSFMLAPAAWGFEHAKVLPKGVRSVNLRVVESNISETTDGHGQRRPLADPLNQDLTFSKIAAGQDALKADKLRAFLTSHDEFSESDVVGRFSADLNGFVSVVAPIASYGVTDRLTLAIAVPMYRANTSIAVGFKPTEKAAAFLQALANPAYNQVAEAHEAAAELNNAVGKLNEKLIENGYQSLGDWDDRGLGDMTVAAKYRFLDVAPLGAAFTGGFVAPTGRVDDPDILNDIAFGDGQWDVFGQFAVDEGLGAGFALNQFAKYTVQLPDSRTVRAVTADEAIEVERRATRFKLGDKVDAGASLTYEPRFGLVTGVGYTYFRKFGDLYRELDTEVKRELEEGTDQVAHNAEFAVGYSTVPLYQAGAFAVPFELKLSYTRQLTSQNMPVSDLAQFDLSLYF